MAIEDGPKMDPNRPPCARALHSALGELAASEPNNSAIEKYLLGANEHSKRATSEDCRGCLGAIGVICPMIYTNGGLTIGQLVQIEGIGFVAKHRLKRSLEGKRKPDTGQDHLLIEELRPIIPQIGSEEVRTHPTFGNYELLNRLAPVDRRRRGTWDDRRDLE